MGIARLGPPDRPGGERQHGNRQHGRHKPAGHRIGQALDRRARTLRVGYHLHDPRQHGIAPDLFGADGQRAGLVHGAADHAVVLGLRNRHRFAGDHRFVERGVAVIDPAIDRHAFARAHAEQIAHDDTFDRHFLIAAVGLDPARGLGGKIEQRLDRARGFLTRAQFEHLTQQHQHGDHRRRLEIDRDNPIRVAEGSGKYFRRQDRDHAVAPGGPGPHRNQCKHIEIARFERGPGALEERPAGPQHHRCREDELEHRGNAGRHQPVQGGDQVPAHFQHKNWNRQRQRDPEAPPHIDIFRAGSGIGAGQLGFERHAADRAGAGMILPHCGMHRTGPDRARRNAGCGRCDRAQVFVRIGRKLRAATRAAKVIVVSSVAGVVRRPRRIDHHAADRIVDCRFAVRRSSAANRSLARMMVGVGHGAVLGWGNRTSDPPTRAVEIVCCYRHRIPDHGTSQIPAIRPANSVRLRSARPRPDRRSRPRPRNGPIAAKAICPATGRAGGQSARPALRSGARRWPG